MPTNTVARALDDDAAGQASARPAGDQNLSVVLNRVIEAGPRSRATIAHDTGLGKNTVSKLVSELVELGLLRDIGFEDRRSAGRPGALMEVDPAGAVGLGLEIGVDLLAVRATDLAGRSRYAAIDATDNRAHDMQTVLGRLAAMTRDALDEIRGRGLRPVGATVALPELADLGWSNEAVVERLRALIDAPDLPLDTGGVIDLAAIGELWLGKGTGLNSFVYVTGSAGVGAAIVIDRELFHAARHFGGQFGHIVVDPQGEPCRCGHRGCLNTRVGLEPLLARAGLGGSPLSALATQARAGDSAALEALTECGRWLGIGLGTVVNLLAPEAIVLGGHFAPLAAWLRPAIESELRGRALGAVAGVPTIIASQLGREAALRGAAATQVRRIVDAPATVRDLPHAVSSR